MKNKRWYPWVLVGAALLASCVDTAELYPATRSRTPRWSTIATRVGMMASSNRKRRSRFPMGRTAIGTAPGIRFPFLLLWTQGCQKPASGIFPARRQGVDVDGTRRRPLRGGYRRRRNRGMGGQYSARWNRLRANQEVGSCASLLPERLFVETL